MARTDASTVTADPVPAAVTPSASSPSVSPTQLAEATTWTTRAVRRAGRLSRLAEADDVFFEGVEDMDITVPVRGGGHV
ncbi:hypothetical protein GCM10010321_27000 [Streptomyces chartreusis]|nr:hypothetical protein GCM10010321_27000 [Streptomyces chartreusis]